MHSVNVAEKLRGFFNEQKLPPKQRLILIGINVILMLVLFYVVLNIIVYDWTGTIYSESAANHLDWVFGGLDDKIPFVPQMDIFYYYIFYPLVIITMCFFAFIESRKGLAFGCSLVLINLVADVIYIFFPVSTQPFRDAIIKSYTGGDFWTNQILNVVYLDTPFNCFPSLHAAFSTICFYAFYRYAKFKPNKWTKLTAGMVLIFAIGIIASTLFVKQHYIADEIAGVLLALVVGIPIFHRLWKDPDPAQVLGQTVT